MQGGEKMVNFNDWRHFFLKIVLLLSATLYWRCMLFSETGEEGYRLLNKKISEKIDKPNEWGYSISPFDYPSLSNLGMTYYISSTFCFRNRRYESVTDAEELFVDIYKDFIKNLNSIREIRPFLAEFPLTPETVRMCVKFADEKGENLAPPYLASVIFRNNQLIFNQFIADEHLPLGFCFKHICEKDSKKLPRINELYFPSIPREKLKTPPKMITITRPLLDTSVDLAFFEFIKKFSKKKNLEFITLIRVGENVHEFWPFQCALRGSQRLSLNDARTLASNCAFECRDFLEKDKFCLNFMKERSTWKHITDRSLVPDIHHFAFRISFWDENIDRQSEPYIAEIRFLGGKLKYFTADVHQRLVLVHEETFDEAQHFLSSSSES